MELIMSKKREFKNKNLKAATARIRKAGEAVRINVYKIAMEMYRIHDRKLWVEDGYEDVSDYANKVLHIKKTMCYDLISIGKTFVADNGRESNLTRSEDCKEDYTVGQLRLLLPIGYEKSEEMSRDGIITPDMSVRQMKRVIRYNMTGEDPEDPEDPGEPDGSEVALTSEIPEPPESLITIADGEIFFTDRFLQLGSSELIKIVAHCNSRMKEVAHCNNMKEMED